MGRRRRCGWRSSLSTPQPDSFTGSAALRAGYCVVVVDVGELPPVMLVPPPEVPVVVVAPVVAPLVAGAVPAVAPLVGLTVVAVVVPPVALVVAEAAAPLGPVVALELLVVVEEVLDAPDVGPVAVVVFPLAAGGGSRSGGRVEGSTFGSARSAATSALPSQIAEAAGDGSLTAPSFQEALFQEAESQETLFQEALFQEALFQEAEFQETLFQEALFQEAEFQEALFQETEFQETFARTALFQEALSKRTELVPFELVVFRKASSARFGFGGLLAPGPKIGPIRTVPTPPAPPRFDRPVAVSIRAPFTWSGVQFGCWSRIVATAPETTGAANDVPESCM